MAETMAQHWPADAVERRPLASLLPYARNARTHSDAQVAQIAASIREFGFVVPILIDEAGTIIAGHGRVLAAAKLGLGEVPIMVARGWTPAQIAAYRLVDNQLALNSGWDDALLKIELADLSGFGFDMDLLGFSGAELSALMGGGGNPVSLADRFGIPPFSVLNAREGWWQDRKRAWIALGIQSELGRGNTGVRTPHEGHGAADGLIAVRAKEKAGRKPNAIPGGSPMPLDRKQPNATPGGSPLPAADYSKTKARGNGRGRAI